MLSAQLSIRYILGSEYILYKYRTNRGTSSAEVIAHSEKKERMKIEPPAEYDDVNEAAIAEWKQETTTRERIRSVIQRIREPTPASAIAERARASEPVVRDALAELADLGLVETLDAGQGALYKRNDQMHIYRQVIDLQETYDEDELVAKLQDLKETVNTFREKYAVESPTELAQELEPDDAEGWEDHTTWQTAQKNLYLAKAAISFYDAERVVA